MIVLQLYTLDDTPAKVLEWDNAYWVLNRTSWAFRNNSEVRATQGKRGFDTQATNKEPARFQIGGIYSPLGRGYKAGSPQHWFNPIKQVSELRGGIYTVDLVNMTLGEFMLESAEFAADVMVPLTGDPSLGYAGIHIPFTLTFLESEADYLLHNQPTG